MIAYGISAHVDGILVRCWELLHTMQSVRFTSIQCNHLIAIAINALESYCMLQPFHLDTAYYSVNLYSVCCWRMRCCSYYLPKVCLSFNGNEALLLINSVACSLLVGRLYCLLVLPWAVLIKLISLRVSGFHAVLFSQLGSSEVQFIVFPLLHHHHHHVTVMSWLRAFREWSWSCP